ncbi:MAG TPA: NUDIX hydrolase [Vicinamibacteria bacterium]|nr:NUDIX hydrolase [Vicinamibacteria bacterium]
MSDRTVVAEGRHLRFVVEDGWEFVERPVAGVAVIVAVTPSDRLLLVEQFRPPVRRRVLELPAGLAGDLPGHEREELADAARRELLEETGYEAETMDVLAQGPPAAGVTSEVVTFFRAGGLRRAGPGGGGPDEDIVVHEVELAHVREFLEGAAGRDLLVDPKVFAGLYLVGRPSPPA